MNQQNWCVKCQKDYWPNQAWLHKKCLTNGERPSMSRFEPGADKQDVTAGETAPKAKFDRVAYQRGLMRKRRAEGKA